LDEKGANQNDINAYVDSLHKGSEEDRENRLMSAGQVAGLIGEIPTVEELIRGMAAEAKGVAQSIGKQF